MLKAFDTQDLVERLKKEALPLAEAELKVVIDKVLLPWLKDSLKLEAVDQPLYAIAIPVLDALQKPIDDALASLLGVAPDAAPAVV